MRQRLSLAVAMVHRPELLILDEPTSGVDPIARDHFWRLMVELARRERYTVICIGEGAKVRGGEMTVLRRIADSGVARSASQKPMKSALSRSAASIPCRTASALPPFCAKCRTVMRPPERRARSSSMPA